MTNRALDRRIFDILGSVSLSSEDKSLWLTMLGNADEQLKKLFVALFEDNAQDIEPITALLKKKMSAREMRGLASEIAAEERTALRELMDNDRQI